MKLERVEFLDVAYVYDIHKEVGLIFFLHKIGGISLKSMRIAERIAWLRTNNDYRPGQALSKTHAKYVESLYGNT